MLSSHTDVVSALFTLGEGGAFRVARNTTLKDIIILKKLNTTAKRYRISGCQMKLTQVYSYILASQRPQKLSMGSLPVKASGPARSLSTRASRVEGFES